MSLEQIRHAISTACDVDDPTMRAVYTATARALVAQIRAELDRLDGHVRSIEVEIGRRSRHASQPDVLRRVLG